MHPCPVASLVRASGVASLLVASACVTSQFDDAPLDLQTTVAVVRAHREQDLQVIQALVEDLDPRVRAIIRPRRSEPPRIVVQPPGANCSADACTITMRHDLLGMRNSRFIVLRADAPCALRFLLAHELVHWYADWAWDCLPIAIEEGLADTVACRLDPEFGARRMAFLAGFSPLSAADVDRLLRVERGHEHRLPCREREQLYLVGRQIVDALGVDQLRSRCDADGGSRRQPPIEWFASALHVTPPSELAAKLSVAVPAARCVVAGGLEQGQPPTRASAPVLFPAANRP